MQRLIRRVAVSALLFLPTIAASAGAECVRPPRAPNMPQGATATDEEMKAGHDVLQTYVNTLQQYGTCIENELKAAPPDAKPEFKAALVAKADAAVEAAHEIADIYSIQLRAFKARQ